MLGKIASAPKRAATHIVRCRARYAATAGFITGAVVMRKLDADMHREMVAFLKEKELYDEFFALTDEI